MTGRIQNNILGHSRAWHDTWHNTWHDTWNDTWHDTGRIQNNIL